MWQSALKRRLPVVPATGVTLDKTTLNLMMGETAVLTAAAQPENTTDTLTWTTGNEAVATVADGVVTAVGAGSTVITAACGSVKAECAVTVTASPLTVSVGGKAWRPDTCWRRGWDEVSRRAALRQ